VRSAVTGIRAAGFAAELASAALLLRTSGVGFEHHQQAANLPDPVECALALILREAVTNIARHARATHARVSLTRTGGVLRLLVEDDGRGGIDTHGNGLNGMRERVQALGGTLWVDSPRGAGTRLDISVPLRTNADAATAPGATAPASGMMEVAATPAWVAQERHAL
jgi:two-component system sensor histidine kinase DesK